MSDNLDYMDEENEVGWSDDKPDDISELFGFDFDSGGAIDRSGLRALINSALVSHRRLPMLDVVFDRAARAMSTSLRQMTDDNVDVTLDDVTSTRFGDYIGALPLPTVVGVAYSSFLDNYCLVSADATLVSSIVDLLLGGRRSGTLLAIDERAFTAIELSLAERMLSLLVGDLDEAFKPVAATNFSLDRIETTPRFAAIVQEASVCAMAKFRINIGGLAGKASIIIPHATLEPLRNELLREFIGDGHGSDEMWPQHLAREVQLAKVDIRAVLAEKDVQLSDVRRLKKGDTMVFNASASTSIDVRSGGSLIGRGKIGRSGERVAIKLEQGNQAASTRLLETSCEGEQS